LIGAPLHTALLILLLLPHHVGTVAMLVILFFFLHLTGAPLDTALSQPLAMHPTLDKIFCLIGAPLHSALLILVTSELSQCL
jgi:hypothetical protein